MLLKSSQPFGTVPTKEAAGAVIASVAFDVITSGDFSEDKSDCMLIAVVAGGLGPAVAGRPFGLDNMLVTALEGRHAARDGAVVDETTADADGLTLWAGPSYTISFLV